MIWEGACWCGRHFYNWEGSSLGVWKGVGVVWYCLVPRLLACAGDV